MDFLLGAVIAALLVGAVWAYRSRQSDDEEAPKQLPDGEASVAASGGRPLMDLKVDDIVSHLGTDYLVEGRIDYREGTYEWVEYMLVDGEAIRWMCVEDDDQLEVTFWDEVEDLHASRPVPEILEYDGNEYKMYERGEAEASQTGQTGRKQARSVEYFDYRGPEDLLGVEIWNEEFEIFRGEEVDEVMLDVFPGDEVVVG